MERLAEGCRVGSWSPVIDTGMGEVGIVLACVVVLHALAVGLDTAIVFACDGIRATPPKPWPEVRGKGDDGGGVHAPPR